MDAVWPVNQLLKNIFQTIIVNLNVLFVMQKDHIYLNNQCCYL